MVVGERDLAAYRHDLLDMSDRTYGAAPESNAAWPNVRATMVNGSAIDASRSFRVFAHPVTTIGLFVMGCPHATIPS